MQKRKLFISFTGLMYALKAGRITDDDLASGLFAFGCTRGHAITPGASEPTLPATACPAGVVTR